MKIVNGRQFAELLVRKGWKLSRINLNHSFFTRDGNIERISLPMHANQSLKSGLLRYLMKIVQANEIDL